jgi:hypothetical protein
VTPKVEWPAAPGKLVVVKWLDPMDLGSGWVTVGVAAKSRAAPCVTVGWIVHEDEHSIVVASSVAGGGTDNEVGGGMAIPTSTIESIDVVTFG